VPQCPIADDANVSRAMIHLPLPAAAVLPIALQVYSIRAQRRVNRYLPRTPLMIFLVDPAVTVTRYNDRLLTSYCRLSVCRSVHPSVMPCIVTGAQGREVG